MSDQIKSQVISRRKALFLVGLAASLAVPAVITASDAEAQQPSREEKKEKREEKKEKREERKEKREERKEKEK